MMEIFCSKTKNHDHFWAEADLILGTVLFSMEISESIV